MKISWEKIAYQMDYLYPFALISIGSMLFGYELRKPDSFYHIFLLLLYLLTASFGGSALDKRLR